MADKFKRYGVPVRLENTPIFKKLFADIEKFLDEKVAKRTTAETVKRVYAYNNTGDIDIPVSDKGAAGGSLVQRNTSGCIVCNDPYAPGHAATKRYVDDAIAALKAELTH